MNKQLRSGHLPRLSPQSYQGLAIAHVTMTAAGRDTGWLTPGFHMRCRETLLHALVKYRVLCPVYCLMPDHAHFVWMGLGANSDLLRTAEFFRRHTNRWLAPYAWQKEFYDHVLKEREREFGVFGTACHYVLENPVRKSLVKEWIEYPFSGAVLPGYPDVDPRRKDFWNVFWKIYNKAVCPG